MLGDGVDGTRPAPPIAAHIDCVRVRHFVPRRLGSPKVLWIICWYCDIARDDDNCALRAYASPRRTAACPPTAVRRRASSDPVALKACLPKKFEMAKEECLRMILLLHIFIRCRCRRRRVRRRRQPYSAPLISTAVIDGRRSMPSLLITLRHTIISIYFARASNISAEPHITVAMPFSHLNIATPFYESKIFKRVIVEHIQFNSPSISGISLHCALD